MLARSLLKRRRYKKVLCACEVLVQAGRAKVPFLTTTMDGLQVEDIVDTGGTLQTLLEALQQQGAASVKTVALLNKSEKRKVDVPVDYCCFEVGPLTVAVWSEFSAHIASVASTCAEPTPETCYRSAQMSL